MLLIRPGTRTNRVDLQTVLRERHNALKDAVAKEIEQRTKQGIPLNDDLDWNSVRAAANAEDEAAVRAALVDGIEPVEDYADDARIEGLSFDCVSLARFDYMALIQGMPKEPVDRMHYFQAGLEKAEFKVYGFKDENGVPVVAEPADIVNMGLVGECWIAFMRAQELDPELFGRSG